MSQHSSHGPEWEALKLRVWERDGYQCQYCGKYLDGTNGPDGRTVDHIVAKANGGQDSIENCLSACRSCNGKKSTNDIVRHAWVNPSWLTKLPG